MITKDGQKIIKYLFIDRMCEGNCFISANENEEIIGRIDDYGTYIEHIRISDKATLRTVNVTDVSEIIFIE